MRGKSKKQYIRSGAKPQPDMVTKKNGPQFDDEFTPDGGLVIQPTKPRRVSARGARKKGHDFEREVAAFFRMIGFLQAGRNLEQFQKHKQVGVDLENTGPFRVQCKNHQKYPNLSIIEEITDKSGIPLLIAKANAKRPLVALPLEDFMRMAQLYMASMQVDLRQAHRWTNPEDVDLGF